MRITTRRTAKARVLLEYGQCSTGGRGQEREGGTGHLRQTISGSSRVSNGKLVLVCSPSGSLSTMIGSGTLSWRKRRRVVEGGGDGDVVRSHGQHVGEGDS